MGNCCQKMKPKKEVKQIPVTLPGTKYKPDKAVNSSELAIAITQINEKNSQNQEANLIPSILPQEIIEDSKEGCVFLGVDRPDSFKV